MSKLYYLISLLFYLYFQKLFASHRPPRRNRIFTPERPERDGEVREDRQHNGRDHSGALSFDGFEGGRRERSNNLSEKAQYENQANRTRNAEFS